MIRFPRISFYRKLWKIPKELTKSFKPQQVSFDTKTMGRSEQRIIFFGLFWGMDSLVLSVQSCDFPSYGSFWTVDLTSSSNQSILKTSKERKHFFTMTWERATEIQMETDISCEWLFLPPSLASCLIQQTLRWLRGKFLLKWLQLWVGHRAFWMVAKFLGLARKISNFFFFKLLMGFESTFPGNTCFFFFSFPSK